MSLKNQLVKEINRNKEYEEKLIAKEEDWNKKHKEEIERRITILLEAEASVRKSNMLFLEEGDLYVDNHKIKNDYLKKFCRKNKLKLRYRYNCQFGGYVDKRKYRGKKYEFFAEYYYFRGYAIYVK